MAQNLASRVEALGMSVYGRETSSANNLNCLWVFMVYSLGFRVDVLL